MQFYINYEECKSFNSFVLTPVSLRFILTMRNVNENQEDHLL